MNRQIIYFLIIGVLISLSDSILNLIYKRRYKKDPDFVYKNPANNSHRFLGRCIFLMRAIYILVIIYHLTGYNFGGLISMVDIINIPILWSIGFVLGTGFITISVFARLHLGGSWRVGIDEETTDKLVTTGIYKWIRNPYFGSLLGGQLSVVLISPNAITIFCFLIGIILWGFQVRNEEEFLISKYGNDYKNYKNKTGRFIPKLIK